MKQMLPVADRQVADTNDRVLGLDFPAGQLKRLADPHDRVDAVNDAELVHQLRVDVAEYGDDGALFAVDAMVFESELANDLLDVRDLFFACSRFHYYDHLIFS